MSLRKGAILLLFLVAIVGGVFFVYVQKKEVTLKIFCAGSLAVPLREFSREFEIRNPGVKVVVETSGSVMAVRKIVELNKMADVLAVADYKLIPELMIPGYADFYISFASNKIVLAYTDKSRYADEIDSRSWVRILMREDVRYGFSNPNIDPCGYRALMVLALAERYYRAEDLFERLVINKSNLKLNTSGDELFIYIPSDFKSEADSNLVVRPKSVDLIALLEIGSLDYAFEYMSVAIQHGLKYIELPSEIDLSDPRFNEVYRKVHVYLFYGTDKQKEVTGESITYALTIPKNARNRDLAIKFVNLLLGDVGREIFGRSGQPFLRKLKVFGGLPEGLELGDDEHG